MRHLSAVRLFRTMYSHQRLGFDGMRCVSIDHGIIITSLYSEIKKNSQAFPDFAGKSRFM